MKALLAITTILVLPAALARPIVSEAVAFSEHLLFPRATSSNTANSSKGKASASNQQQAVTGAASSFANDVATVSASLNGLGTTTDPSTTRSLARKALTAEKDEDQHRAVLNGAAGTDARSANQKIVDNTPVVLNGLQSIISDPSTANTMKNLAKIESARNANILPSITQLSNSAFKQTGVKQQAKQFKPTSGTSALRSLQASKKPSS